MKINGSYVSIVADPIETIEQFAGLAYRYIEEKNIANAVCVYRGAECIVHFEDNEETIKLKVEVAVHNKKIDDYLKGEKNKNDAA